MPGSIHHGKKEWIKDVLLLKHLYSVIPSHPCTEQRCQKQMVGEDLKFLQKVDRNGSSF